MIHASTLWKLPTVHELKMDAEIGAYQDDGEPRPDPLSAGETPEPGPGREDA
jgi:hypothetical protein